MKIVLENISKKFEKDWIFKNVNQSFTQGNNYAITGNNGSGKSTLLQCIAGFSMCTKGKVQLFANDILVNELNHHLYLSIAAPYLELIEELTAYELLIFHQKFKPLLPNITINEILSSVKLDEASKKQIKNFSSGMKQRLKLAQAIFSDTPILLLDEPCSNLDKQGINIYHSLIKNYCAEKLIIMGSNDAEEYSFCNKIINMQQLK